MTAYVLTGNCNIRELGTLNPSGSATARTGGDTVDTNGFNFTIDQDTRYGLTGTTSTSFGNITINASKGGNVTIDGRYVRLIPFNTGSGTITAGTLITVGSATAKVIGLYSSLTTAPVLTGVATGYLKVTEWNGVDFPTSGSYTQAGYTFTITGASTPGWIEVVGDEAGTINANRLGTLSVLGAWYEFLGATTTGTRTSTYQIPTNGSLTYVPGVWVQSASATITAATAAAGSITYTSSGHGFNVGQEVSITGASPAGYNVIDAVITSKTTNTFTITATDPGAWVSGGSASVYEFYPNAGSRPALVANIQTDSLRGKWCWITTAGLVYFGSDGTNSTGGYIVPAGRKLRVPNVFLQNCTTAARTANVLPNATLATRYDFTTTGGGAIVMNKVSSSWYMSFAQAFSVDCKYVSTFESIAISETASPIVFWDVGVGQTGTANTQIALNFNLMFAGGTVRNCTMSRIAQAASGAYIESWADCAGFTVTNHKSLSLTKAANATTGSATMTRLIGCTFENCVAGGGRYFLIGCDSTVFTNTVYYDNIAATTGTAIPMYVWEFGTAASYNMKFDGLSFGGLSLVQPYSGVLNIGVAGCNNIKLRNLGTAAAPMDMGGPMVDATWTRATTVTTVTKVAHGLKTGDIIAVNMCSDVAPKAVTTTTATLWTIASAPTADTFTVTVTNAGQTTGQNLRYYPTMAGVLVNFVAAAAANGVYIQRCYTPNLRTGVISGADNSSKNIYLEDVWGTEWGVQLNPLLNCFVRQLQSTPALTAQTSVYGTHFMDYYTTAQPASTSAVSWSRSTTTCTVTSNNHGLRVGDQVLVTVTSDAAAVVLGVKTLTQITAVATPVNVGNTFQFTCLNAGAASGTLTFTPINARVAIQMNEATAETSNQVVLSGGAAFTSAGSLYMPTVGQYAIFTADKNIKGHGSFPNATPVMAGGTLGNYNITYSLDGGTTYRNLYYPRAGGGGASASTTVTMTSTTGVAVDDYVWGTGIAPMAKVVSITNATTIVVNIANTGTVSGVLNFAHLPAETIASSSNGFPLKVKIETATANTTPITSFYFLTNANTTDRSAVYALDTNTLTFTDLIPGSEVRAYTGSQYDPLSAVEIGGTESSGTSFAFQHSSGGVSGYVQIITNDSLPITLPITYLAADQSIPIQQSIDRQYSNPV
jgi:hypothetical protein